MFSDISKLAESLVGTGPDPEVFHEMWGGKKWVHPHGVQQQQEWRDIFLAEVDKLAGKVNKTVWISDFCLKPNIKLV